MLDSIVILVDTREKVNDHVLKYFDYKKIPWKTMKLDYMDYSFVVPANEKLGIPRDLYFNKEIAIERKADLDELSGNLTKDRERLKREFTLSPSNKIMIIESASYVDMVKGNYTSSYDAKSFYGTFHSFWHEFNLPIVFIPDKNYTGMFIHGYFYYYLRGLIK